VLGALLGDSIGSYLEFKTKVTVKERQQAMKMIGGGPFNLAPGQVTDDGELTMALVHAIS
jgi:ADP-ribosylglycohydrolase